jgi:hypothetical protein
MQMSDMDFGGEMDGEVGTVDMFGLDEFGMPAGAESLWGAVIGGGLGTGAAMLTRALVDPLKSPKLYGYSEGIGFLAAGLAGGIMYAFPATKRMALAAVAMAFVNNGLRQMEMWLHAPKAAGYFGGVAIDRAYPVPGSLGQDVDVRELGIPSIEPGYAVLGAPVIESQYPVPGTVGFAGRPELVGPPTLVGAGNYGLDDNPGVRQLAQLGGPEISALGAHYGATLFGGQS